MLRTSGLCLEAVRKVGLKQGGAGGLTEVEVRLALGSFERGRGFCAQVGVGRSGFGGRGGIKKEVVLLQVLRRRVAGGRVLICRSGS